MENLISTCYVVEKFETGFVCPVIYLNIPEHGTRERIHGFDNVFEAKNFIRATMGYGIVLEINKDHFDKKKYAGL
jgi:hypothetical protein